MSREAEMHHKYMVRRMKLKPSLIGLDGIVLSTGESPMFEHGEIVREPDGLMFDPSTHTLYNLEYKITPSTSARNRAKAQLKDTWYRLAKVFPEWNVKNLYVHDNYSVEEIR